MSEEGQFFADMMDRLCQEHCLQAVIESAEEGVFPEQLWGEFQGLGIPLMMTPEEQGGVDASVPDICAVLRVAGRYAVPAPILETVLANAALSRAAIKISDGPLALVFGDKTIGEMLRQSKGESLGDRISFRKVAWAKEVQSIVIVASSSSGVVVGAMDSKTCNFESVPAMSREPRYKISCGRASVKTGFVDDDGFSDEMFRAAALCRSAQMIGAIEWTLDTTVSYGMERSQFGRPITKFQVVQHQLAELASSLAAASALFNAAVDQFENDSGLVAAARARLGDSVDTAVSISHQLHAATGFSREYGLNFRTRRLMQWRDEFGSTEYWRRRVGESLLGARYEEVWERMIGADGGEE